MRKCFGVTGPEMGERFRHPFPGGERRGIFLFRPEKTGDRGLSFDRRVMKGIGDKGHFFVGLHFFRDERHITRLSSCLR